MSHAYIYDHLRTPRGKGKKDGSLHQATPTWLLRTLLKEMERRNELDTSLVDDVVLGCVTPIGEQGADIARTAVLDAEWAQTCAGVTQSRFCASGLESVNLAAAKVASGFEDLVVGGGVESMSRWKMGSDGGAWAMDPRVNDKLGFMPQGIGADLIATMEGFSRTDVDTFALNSHKQRRGRARCRALQARRDPGDRHRRPAAARPRRDHPRQRQPRSDGQAGGQLHHHRPDGLRRHRAAQVHHGGEDQPRAPRRQLQRHRRRRRADADRQPRGRQEGGPESPARASAPRR